MQRRKNIFPILLGLAVLVLGGGIFFLISKQVPAPLAAVDKPLAATAFIKE